jgi:hypothetical protein
MYIYTYYTYIYIYIVKDFNFISQTKRKIKKNPHRGLRKERGVHFPQKTKLPPPLQKEREDQSPKTRDVEGEKVVGISGVSSSE